MYSFCTSLVSYFRVFTAITFGGQSLGRATSYLPDYSKAKLSAAKMLTLFKRVPEIDSSSTAGAKPVSA